MSKSAVWLALSYLFVTTVVANGDSKSRAVIFPRGVIGDTGKLEFHVSTPSSVGTLEVQTRAALKELFEKSKAATILKLRVFAVGSADLMAVQRVARETFPKSKRPLPVLSLVGVAGFPEVGQQVEIESVVQGQESVDPSGLAFIGGLQSPGGDKTISGLARVARESGVAALSVMRVSCFFESPEQAVTAKAAITEAFPAAESSFVFSLAADAKPVIECEAVARLSAPEPAGVRYFNLPGAPASPYFSRAALVSVPSLIFTGSEMVLGASEPEARRAFERAKTTVEQLGGKLTDVVMGDNYWLSPSARDRNREVRTDYFGQTVPAATGVFFSGLSSAKATQAIELVVAVRNIRLRAGVGTR